MSRTVARALAALATAAIGLSAQVQPQPDLPPTAERAYTAIKNRVEDGAAMDVVRFMQQYWRLAGNPGFDASIDEIASRLKSAGFGVSAGTSAGLRLAVETYTIPNPAWDYSRGTVSIEGDPIPVLSRERDRVSLAINSFSTAAQGLSAPLIDVGRGRAEDYSGKTIQGAVVLGDAGLGSLWSEAVRNRGAAGVISTEIAGYSRPTREERMSEEHRDVLQWGTVPYDESRKAFGFKASWRAAGRLRDALRLRRQVRVQVAIDSSFRKAPARTLVAEIPGRSRPEERIVIAAHVQEPGANDNASGCATLYALAAALARGIRDGAIAAPERTLTFLWLDEIRGSRQWLTSHAEESRKVQYMFSMDMTGEDTGRTGGTFLIEKQADPSAVWLRPSDPHSEWGAGQVRPESLKGSLLNDLHLAVADRRARDAGWTVRTNPYEGGSDHTVFASAGIPSLLNWHFTDRYYHTNQDTADKVSPGEMANVAITVATSAYFLASADERDSMATVALVERAAQARLDLERRQGRELVAAAPDRAAAEKVEALVMSAWLKWYGEALDSVRRLAATGASAAVDERVAAARASLTTPR